MEDLKAIIIRAQAGDLDAFGTIVERFQDMAVGYAYSILGDFHLAQDAAQEAFLSVYRHLPTLRAPDAFPSWFRRVVFKHCNRITRGARIELVSLETAIEIPSDTRNPAEVMEEREMRENVLQAIQTLPENERVVTTLFYINDFSQKEIAAFLDIPETTVISRLRYARKRLKERLVDDMVRDTFAQQRPSRDEQFVKEVLFKAIQESDAEKVKELLSADPSLTFAEDDKGRTPIQTLVKAWYSPSAIETSETFNSRKLIYNLLVNHGATPDLDAAIYANDVTRVREMLDADPKCVEKGFDIRDIRGVQPLTIAAFGGRLEILELLFEAGADVHADRDVALTLTFNLAASEWLIAKGAKVNPYPNASFGPLVRACEIYDIGKIRLLLAHGADPDACVYAQFHPKGHWNRNQSASHPGAWLFPGQYPIPPLLVAMGTTYFPWGTENECVEALEVLINAGADLSKKYTVEIGRELSELTPLGYALKHPAIFCDARDEPYKAELYEKVIDFLRKHDAPE